MDTVTHDENGTRYTLVSDQSGDYNWLFFPGGPGGDSSYIRSLADCLELPGKVWLIDLPNNGTNKYDGFETYDYDKWLDLYTPIVKRFDFPIHVGHSFGAMLPLLNPELESVLKGLVVLHSSPSLWMERAVEYGKQFDLPDLTVEMTEFTQNPTQETFDIAFAACAPYYFSPEKVEQGREMLKQIPFCFQAAVWWQQKAIKEGYEAKWIPQEVPTAIIGGKYDCIVPFEIFEEDKRFHRENIQLIFDEEIGHIGWSEKPEVYQNAFAHLLEEMQESAYVC